jgi:folate-binding protein YgfZ
VSLARLKAGTTLSCTDHYRALRENAVIGAVAARSAIGVAGTDRTSYLQGLLTNDIQALNGGTGCYAAWLTPQGRMLTDLHVFESGDTMLLDVPADRVEATLQRLDQFLFSEDVRLADLSQALRSVWVHGPAAPSTIERVLSGSPELDSWSDYRNARVEFEGKSAVVARVSQLGVPGFCLYAEPPHDAELVDALRAAGAVAADRDVIEAARIEAGYPVFGVDMTDDTIPLEAGIEDRAISFTKGCYVGQEVVIRVLHRGQGRVARRLVGLRIAGDVAARGAKIFSADREIGTVTSAVRSPRFGSIALGYVHRDFVEPGTGVDVEGPGGRMRAAVSERPFS